MHVSKLSFAVLAALAAPSLALAQDQPRRIEVVRARPAQEADAKPLDKATRARLDALVEQLGSPDFEERRAASSKLAAEGEKIRGYLERNIKGAEDPELRWQLRRLLRQLDGERASRLQEDPRAEGGAPAPRFEPRTGVRRDFGDLESELQRMRQEMDEMIRRMRSGNFGLPGGMPDLDTLREQMQRGQGSKIMIQPGKVSVELQTEEDGKVQTKRYEAGSMEELLQKYPELKGKVGGGLRVFQGGTPFGLDFHLGRDFGKELEKRFGGTPVPQRAPEAPRGLTPDRLPAPPAAGPKLGVYIRESISPDLREYLGLDARTGLWVEGLADGGLAEKLGVQKNDIVLEVNGQNISSAADVAKALGARDGKHTVVVLRKGKKLELGDK